MLKKTILLLTRKYYFIDTASGTSIDYMQYYGVPYIYGVELRPEDTDGYFGFTIPPQLIKPTG